MFWQHLGIDAPTPFQSGEWLGAWIEASTTAGRSDQLTIIVGQGTGGTVEFVLPFLYCRRRGMSSLKFAGGTHGTYGTGYFSDSFIRGASAKTMQDLLKKACSLLDSVDVVVLDGLYTSCKYQINPLLMLADGRPEKSSHQLRLEGGWEAVYNRKFSAKTRSKHRNAERRLAELGGLVFTVADTTKRKHELTDAVFAAKSIQLRGEGLPDPFGSTYVKQCYRSLIDRTEQDSAVSVVLSALELDGRPIAICLDLSHNRIRHGLITSVVEGPHLRFSPGSLLLRRNIEYCCGAGITHFDFGVGDGDYKQRWSEMEISRFSTTFPITIRGRLYAMIHVAAHRSLRTIKSHPQLRALMLMINRRFNVFDSP